MFYRGHADSFLWGIKFNNKRPPTGCINPSVCGTDWYKEVDPFVPKASKYYGEPWNPLLFTTRALAREWCSKTNRIWHRGEYKEWTVSPIRIRRVFAVCPGRGADQ